MTAVHIRTPDRDETPLSPEERLVAIRNGFQPYERERWHPEIVRNWSVMSARMNRAAALTVSPARAPAFGGAS